MDIVIDTSALLAVIVAEPERARIVALTKGHTLIGPGSIPWEIGNAFSAMMKQRRLAIEEARKGLKIFETIPIRLITIDMASALAIAGQTNTYAYDAYFIECALHRTAPLLTLDGGLKKAALKLGVQIMEV
jgi:predicted nucleic acid-binding protein